MKDSAKEDILMISVILFRWHMFSFFYFFVHLRNSYIFYEILTYLWITQQPNLFYKQDLSPMLLYACFLQMLSYYIQDKYRIYWINYKVLGNLQETIEECSICRDNISNFKLQTCSHIFCEECINNWCTYDNSCPICRKEIGKIRSRNVLLCVFGFSLVILLFIQQNGQVMNDVYRISKTISNFIVPNNLVNPKNFDSYCNGCCSHSPGPPGPQGISSLQEFWIIKPKESLNKK